MKLVRRISFLLILSGIMLGLGGYGALKAEEFFYPHKYQDKEARVPAKQITQTAQKEEMEEQVIEAAVEDRPVVTADTLYLVETVDLSEGTVDEKEEAIPVKYIGLDREELLEELSFYDNNPPLTEQELGFETIELTAFSKDRVAICKYYRPKKEDRSFYLMVADHFIVVYEEDKRTIYMNTDILLENLSDALQAEIIRGKYVENEEELYHFLESYSS
jgi:hypothetical protein